MQSLEVSGAVRPIYGSLGVKRLNRDAVNGTCSTYVLKVDQKTTTESFI